MRVLVSVDVRNRDPGGLNLANLRARFRGDLFGIHSAGDGARREGFQSIAKAWSRGTPHQRGNFLSAEDRLAIDQHHMTADAQPWQRLRQLRRFAERRAIGHQRGGCHNSPRVSLDNGPVHARSKTKIISVDDQTPHPASLAGMHT
jgi:hypothetical protein